jgi:hypothetical protein
MGEAAPTTTPCRMDNVWAFTSRKSVNKTFIGGVYYYYYFQDGASLVYCNPSHYELQ